jgi:hypothetical protein
MVLQLSHNSWTPLIALRPFQVQFASQRNLLIGADLARRVFNTLEAAAARLEMEAAGDCWLRDETVRLIDRYESHHCEHGRARSGVREFCQRMITWGGSKKDKRREFNTKAKKGLLPTPLS